MTSQPDRTKKADHRHGGILAGLLLTGLAILALAVTAGFYLARNVRVMTAHRNRGDDVSIEIPGGRFEIRAHEDLNPASLGVPVYPGAKRVKHGGGATFAWISRDGNEEKGLSVAGVELYTPDPARDVVEYYRSQLPNWLMITERDGSTRLEFAKGGYKRIIGIREKGDGTRIGVASVGEPASN
jgi:hypothetical protein